MINSDHSTLTKSTEKTEKTIDDIRKDITYLKGSFDLLKSLLRDPKPLFDSQSPVSLTEAGHEVAKELKANEIIGRSWEKIFCILEQNISNKNAYDIQQYCIESISVEPEKFFDSKDLATLKDYAFKKGNPLQLYTRLMGILIRDKYFEVKGIPIDDVDKHDPAKA